MNLLTIALPRVAILLLASFAFAASAVGADRPLFTVTDLRVGNLANPLGLDDPQPPLSWRIESTARGAGQTACRVLAATTAELLAQDQGDLWNSGWVGTTENLRLAYAGVPLRSNQRVFWKVQVLDQNGQPSDWSQPATWTVGMLANGDWNVGTRWITDPELLRWQRAKLGYRSQPAADPLTAKWIQLDLGTAQPIEVVRLRAVAHTVDEKLGFPVRYQLEVADQADFSDARLVVAPAAKDANPWFGVIELPLKEVTARYVRFTATKLRVFHGEACLAVSQMEVISGGRNVAPQARFTAGDSLEDALWSLAAINDGLGAPGVNPRASDTLQLRRAFTVRPGLKRALLSVSGLGHYALAVNGAPFNAGLLTPGWTDYRRTCLYDTLDLTARLRAGANALGLTLGGGMYNVQPDFGRYVKFISAFRPLMAFGELRLEYADGTVEIIGTDERWRVTPGPATYANMFGGEDYDARRETPGWSAAGFDDSAWTPAAPTAGPGGVLRGAAYASPAFVTHESLAAVSVRELRPGVAVYDFGQNASMMPRLRVRGPAGATVRLIPAELLKPDGSVDRGSAGGGTAYWQYTLKGEPRGEAWFPSFFYQGARYLQVELTAPAGAATPAVSPSNPPVVSQSNPPAVSLSNPPIVEELTSVVVHSDSPAAGDFACSNELFNRIRLLVRWAQRSNLAHVISDCPHRERLGWLEQYHLNGPALRYEWDLARLFAKGFNDMADAQLGNGLIPSIAPEYVVFDGGFVDSPEWGSALILAAWQHTLFTGDDTPLRRHYGAMQRYFEYLTSRADGNIISHGLGDWYDLGPKAPGVAQLTPIALTATAIYYEDARALGRIAAFLGHPQDAQRYAARAAEIGAAFNRKFFNPETGVYATGSQTAQAMPLALGLVPAERRAGVVDALLRDISAHQNAVTAGDVGYRYLIRALADSGRSDVLCAMNNQSEKPGYGYQLAHGATSLTEAWDANPRSSQNHFMLGQITEWFYHDLAGIRPDAAAPGFKHILIQPQPVEGLTWVKASHESPNGRISVSWERVEGKFSLAVTIPPNTTAEIAVPAQTTGAVREGRGMAGQSAGVKFLRRDGDRDVFAVVSGSYVFESIW